MRWDVFCKVVDNYGDIGVCWRLARQLAHEYGFAIRLWVDELAAFARLAPEVDAGADVQIVSGIEVRRWREPWPDAEAGDVVLETFGCRLPEGFIAAMAMRAPAPVWLNVEHLSAEDWVAGHHGLPSPHPRLPLTCWYFYPGFSPDTGGLLCEADLAQRRADFQAEPQARRRLATRLGFVPPREDALWVSLFSYPNAALPGLLEAWAQGTQPLVCFAAPTPALAAVRGWLGREPAPGMQFERGALTLAVPEFLPQPRYDELLWACELNFVRGEDSFLRAQWAARPFVWHIYPQDDGVHRAKLDAFLARYRAGLAPGAERALTAFWWAWNSGADVPATWPVLVAALPALATHAQAWPARLAENGSLAARLVEFVRRKL